MSNVVAGRGEGASASLVAALEDAGMTVEAPVAVRVTIFDTFDGRLHDAGLRLEHDGHTLVLDGPGTVPARVERDDVPRFPRHLSPGPLRGRLIDLVEVRALLPRATVSSLVRRVTSRNSEGKVVAAVRIHEQVSGIAGWLVDVEPLTGYDKPAQRAREVVEGCGVALVEGCDAIGLALDAAGVDLSGHHDDPTVALDPDGPAIDGFRRVLANLLASVDANLPGTVDDIDPEFLHDVRVAVRRSRSVLRHGKRVLPAEVLGWSRRDLKSFGQITGRPRDLDVLVEEWDGYVDGLGGEARGALEPLRHQLDEDRADAHRQLSAELVTPQFVAVLDRWRSWLSSGTGKPGPSGDEALVEVVTQHIRKAERLLIAHGRAITPDSPAEDVHEVRKDAKRLRYLLECFGSLLPKAERKAFVKRLKALQDNLGEHQDTEVHAALLRTMADELPPSTPPSTLVAIGQLVEQLEQRRAAAREAFAGRFADYDSKPTRRAMRAMLDGAGGEAAHGGQG